MTDVDHSDAEEILVYVEFEDSIDVQQYRNINVLGINEKNPIVQMDDTFFTGTYEVPLGTYMFFEEDQAPECLDPLFDRVPDKNLKYVCKTRKYVKMEHAYVTEKKGQSEKNEVEKSTTEVPYVEFKSVHDALEHFKVIRSEETEESASVNTEEASTTTSYDDERELLKKDIKKDSKSKNRHTSIMTMPRSSRRSVETLEEMFQELNRKFIKLNKKEIQHNNAVLYAVLERILKLMKNTDVLFKSMKPKLEYMGSYFDGLRVGHPTEFDINLVLTIPVNYDKIELDSCEAQYDYTYIKMPSEFRRLYNNPVTASKGFVKTATWCDYMYRLSVKKFRSWMQSVVDAALGKLPMENGKRILMLNNMYFGLICKCAGPANNITIYHDNSVIDIDLVPTFAFELPKKPVSSKIDFSKKEFEKLRKYYVVPKPTDNDLDWRLTFPFQERHILENKNNLKCVVKLLKQLRDVQGFNKLASYYIKTLFLWEVSVTNESFWKNNSLTFLVMYMLNKLQGALSQHMIPNFWCPNHNLLEKINIETCENWANRLTRIIAEIQKNKIKNPLQVMDYFRPKKY